MSMYTYDPAELEVDEHGFAKPMPTERCVHYPSGNCAGPTLPRTSRSGLTHSLKCDGCQDALDEQLDAIERRYPKQAPADFDPLYAGEVWDEDDY